MRSQHSRSLKAILADPILSGRRDNCTAILVIEADASTCTPFDADDCPSIDLSPTGVRHLSTPVTDRAVKRTRHHTLYQVKHRLQKVLHRQDRLKGLLRRLEETVERRQEGRQPKIWAAFSSFALTRVFDVDAYPETDVSPILVTSSDMTIQCGDDGKRSNSCVVSGGVSQFEIRGAAMLVQFIGVTFEKSRGISIHAAATKDSTAFFVDCEWRRQRRNVSNSHAREAKRQYCHVGGSCSEATSLIMTLWTLAFSISGGRLLSKRRCSYETVARAWCHPGVGRREHCYLQVMFCTEFWRSRQHERTSQLSSDWRPTSPQVTPNAMEF